MKNYLSQCIILMSLLYTCHTYPEDPINDSVLMQMFSEIFAATGVYPDDRNPDKYLLIVNELTGNCMSVRGGEVGIGQQIITSPCQFDEDVKEQSFYIHHAGDGYVGLSTELGTCIGVGYDDGSPVCTGNWCDSPSHQFGMNRHTYNGSDYVHFNQRQTGYCLTASTNPDVEIIIAEYCDYPVYPDYYPEHRWRFCGRNGTLCWPSPRP